MNSLRLLAALLALTLVGQPVNADETAETESRWQLGIALGYGIRTNPLVLSDEIPIAVDLDIAWFGERFFFDNGDVGYTFADNDYVTASVVGRFNSDRVFFGKTDTAFVTAGLDGATLPAATLLEIPDRDYAGEVGLELLAGGHWGRLQLTAHHDVSGTHDGFEVHADYGRGFRQQRWYFEPSIGLGYKSEALNDYYWGVRANEASPALPEYEAGAGVNVHGRLMLGYQLNRNWQFALVAEAERLNDEAFASPIVVDRTVFGYFAGFGYRF